MKQWHFSDKFWLTFYLLWIGIGFAAVPLHLNEENVLDWHLPHRLDRFISICLQMGDPILILLAAINTAKSITEAWGHRLALRWLLVILIVTGGIETLGTLTGFPFGRYVYTENFGPRLGTLPAAIPLAWYVLISNALLLWRNLLPGFILPIEAAIAASLVTLIDWLMEPFATRIKIYWIWDESSIPHRNYLAWWVIAFGLICLFAKSESHRERFDPRPLLILGSIAALFAMTRVLYGV